MTIVTCPECNRQSGFRLANNGKFRCPNCDTEFDPHREQGDPNAPNNPNGFTSDAINPDGGDSGTFWCPDCGNRITRSAAGIEYGHERGIHAGVDRCERRPHPSVVDTQDDRRRAGFATDEIRDCEDNDLLPTSPLRKSEKESA